MISLITKSLTASFLIIGMLIAGFIGSIALTSVPAQAQYGEFVRCENIQDPVRKERCNARIQAAIDRRVDNILSRAARRVQRIIAGSAVNKNALILSVLNVAYWEIWNLFNVIYPLVGA